jgi:hypothetical protein
VSPTRSNFQLALGKGDRGFGLCFGTTLDPVRLEPHTDCIADHRNQLVAGSDSFPMSIKDHLLSLIFATHSIMSTTRSSGDSVHFMMDAHV